MKSELSEPVFEWLLASWVGYQDRPDAIFPDLKNVSLRQLDEELHRAIQNASQPDKAENVWHKSLA